MVVGSVTRPSVLRGEYRDRGPGEYRDSLPIHCSATSVVVGGVTRPPVLGYDALGRLHTVTGATEATRLLWDGDSLAGEYDTGSGSFTQQYLHGPSGDEPLVLFGGSAQYPVADERGSVVATADGAAQGWRAQSYGPYGETGSSGVTVGRFTSHQNTENTGTAYLLPPAMTRRTGWWRPAWWWVG